MEIFFIPSAYWSLSSYNILLLIIVMNNQLYFSSKQHADIIAKNREMDGNLSHVATRFYEMPVDFIKLAQSFVIHMFPVITTRDNIKNTVISAAEYINKNNKPVLIEILIE